MSFFFFLRLAYLNKLLSTCCLFALFMFSGTAYAQPHIKDFFQTALVCTLVGPKLADMTISPLYTTADAECLAIVPDEQERPYYSDAQCTNPLDFQSTSLKDYCELLVDSKQLGEVRALEATAWTHSPGSRLDVGARSLDGLTLPYMQQRVYRTLTTDRGVCELEMRVYAKSPIVDDGITRPSLLAFHGGSWSARGFGFFGLELTIPHYVDAGFVVYAPFYRLLGDSEGSAACNQASIEQIRDDASFALQWVGENAHEYGSSETPVVFGQSAGAHLATSLLTEESDNLRAAILMYPPTDFTDFVLRVQQGFYSDPEGLGILERVIGVQSNSVDLVDINASPIPQNSFPIRIVEQGIEVAPVMMIHGMKDTLVEPRQSVRLCNALSGDTLLPTDIEVQDPGVLRQTINCGPDSELQLIREGQHALDVCLSDTLLPTDLCPAGSRSSRAQVSEAIAEAVEFGLSHASVINDDIGEETNSDDSGTPNDDSGSPSASAGTSGGGHALGLSIFVFLIYGFRCRRVGVKLNPLAMCRRASR